MMDSTNKSRGMTALDRNKGLANKSVKGADIQKNEVPAKRNSQEIRNDNLDVVPKTPMKRA